MKINASILLRLLQSINLTPASNSPFHHRYRSHTVTPATDLLPSIDQGLHRSPLQQRPSTRVRQSVSLASVLLSISSLAVPDSRTGHHCKL
ncbi:hypothetical protein L6452_11528 [Arctium lappa]|uniref:Uncharacterized protein n=1 Tax=Arctium lappa TaxID=4217 RepID=A0ACB9DP44_ARCLA|nr:hypothetical protein L6452_11528 [Arctium lappa]